MCVRVCECVSMCVCVCVCVCACFVNGLGWGMGGGMWLLGLGMIYVCFAVIGGGLPLMCYVTRGGVNLNRYVA